MPGLTTTLIALLISLGIICSPVDLDNLSSDQETQIEIIINEDIGL